MLLAFLLVFFFIFNLRINQTVFMFKSLTIRTLKWYSVFENSSGLMDENVIHLLFEDYSMLLSKL